MNNFRVVLFDLGATLIWFNGEWEATLQQGIQAMQRKLHALGYPVDETFPGFYHETAREYYRWRDDNLTETPAPQVFRQAMRQYCCDDIPEQHVAAALAELYAATQARWQVEDDALPTLTELKRAGYHIGLISNAGYDDDVQTLIDQSGLRPHLEYIITSAAIGIRKPHPEIFQAALNYFAISPAQAVMVGDFLQADILGANRLGMGSVWITRRADLSSMQQHQGRIQPGRTISSLSELPNVLREWAA